MDFLSSWWESIGLLQKALACVAIPSTVILVVQTILMLFGLGFDGDADVSDTSGLDTDVGDLLDKDAAEAVHYRDDGILGMRLFTVRGIVAFFSVGGWMGIAMVDLGLSQLISGLIALAAGFASLVFVANMITWSMKLQEKGNMDINRAIGHIAQVYTTIPPGMKGHGKVIVTFDERYAELEAMTSESKGYKPKDTVRVLEVLSKGVLLVGPVLTETVPENNNNEEEENVNNE
ncbi:MAG: hypothetical protein FWH14_08335 [Oscillospiraceae bacterium]|nr:hypothetical protein [Oscillospiraceae bacterium]